MPTDWKSLTKETVHSFDADEMRGMWDVDFRRATRLSLADGEDEITAERRGWKRALRRTNAVVFGDASGHGMAAGLVMAVTHAIFRTQLPVDPSPAAMVASLNRVLCETGNARPFFAGVYALLESGGDVTAIVAGHPPVLKLDAEGHITQRLGTGSYPLGIKKDVEYSPVTAFLAPGEMLLFHSDGLAEARGASGEEFGDAHIDHLLFRMAGTRPYEVVAALVRDLDLFLGRAAAEDDVSIAAISRKTA